ncbi:hypothetical protein NC651_017353 [Populus alba x Populus x berolinensis]|nr:hypothetical protein NC651_017353 [Populus alba x Populus x berolinensis]
MQDTEITFSTSVTILSTPNLDYFGSMKSMETELVVQVARSLLVCSKAKDETFSSSETAGDDGDSVPGLGKNKNSEHRGVTGESSRCVWRVDDDDELLREIKPSSISSFLKVCLRSWSLKGDRRGAVKSTGLRDGFEEESGLLTGSLCVSLAKPAKQQRD